MNDGSWPRRDFGSAAFLRRPGSGSARHRFRCFFPTAVDLQARMIAERLPVFVRIEGKGRRRTADSAGHRAWFLIGTGHAAVDVSGEVETRLLSASMSGWSPS